ncbi:uncharacterized protein K460DRAFT_377573 [Cucurbitaria berberidis CBS 394.84]|uniref:Uncharacterized protein n=1 Tax=Cucurbitaria berberidis CBS 394.84 TaxID=1168544 RepID=A0A9P4GJG6_9PLEO|nr:uncharacterized protein K460DRAFT_377573 [Cucurbitaria berberidis CBS 394.84]KAF1846339.1 hypothetical protein K460DRAFT_377573 [Cucurbitaria berberidis CBS 394.84]
MPPESHGAKICLGSMENHRYHVKIHTSALSNIRIADSGNLLYGLERVEGKERVAILSLEPYQEIFGKPRIVPVNSQTLNSAKSVVQYLGKFKRADLLREASSNAQPSGTAMLVLDPTGRPAISILRQSRDDGSLVQETFDSEGNAKAQTIVHLPRSIPNNTEVTLLNPGASSTQHSSKRVKVLLGVRPKSSYSFQEACNVSTAKECLPTMFQRHKSSIRTIEGKIQHLVKDYSSSQPTTLLNEEQSHTAGSVKEGGDDDSY